MDREGILGVTPIQSSTIDKEFKLRGSSGNIVNLPKFFFDHLKWQISDELQISVVNHIHKPKDKEEHSHYSILIENVER